MAFPVAYSQGGVSGVKTSIGLEKKEISHVEKWYFQLFQVFYMKMYINSTKYIPKTPIKIFFAMPPVGRSDNNEGI